MHQQTHKVLLCENKVLFSVMTQNKILFSQNKILCICCCICVHLLMRFVMFFLIRVHHCVIVFTCSFSLFLCLFIFHHAVIVLSDHHISSFSHQVSAFCHCLHMVFIIDVLKNTCCGKTFLRFNRCATFSCFAYCCCFF